jgi:hypothetical protein
MTEKPERPKSTPGRPIIKDGPRHGQPRTRVQGGGYGKPPHLRRTRSDKGVPRKPK